MSDIPLFDFCFLFYFSSTLAEIHVNKLLNEWNKCEILFLIKIKAASITALEGEAIS